MDQPQAKPQGHSTTKMAAAIKTQEPNHPTTSLHPSPNLSADETLDTTAATENADDMARDHHHPGRGGRGPPARRPDLDLSAVLNIEQKNYLIQLVNAILDGMYKHARDFWDDLGDDAAETRERIKPLSELKVSCCSIPNPRSTKYAHLYGNTPLVPESTENPSAKDTADAATATKTNPKDKGAKTSQNTTATETPAPMPVLAPGTKLTVPKSMEEAIRMSGHNNDNEVVKFQMFEIRRDMLAHFSKWRGTVSKRLGDIVIRNGGTAGNVVMSGQGPSHTGSGHGRRGGGGAGAVNARGAPPMPNSTQVGTSFQEFNSVNARVYSAYTTPLQNCPKEKRALILHCMLLILLGLENYSTWSRMLLLLLANSLQVPFHVLTDDEGRCSRALSTIIEGISAEEIAQRRYEEGRTRRWKQLKVPDGVPPPSRNGAVSQGGLPASLISAGLSTVFGGLGLAPDKTAGLLGPMAESTVPVGMLFGLYGSRATAKMVETYVKDIQDFALLPLHGITDKEMTDPKDLPAQDRRLRLTIGVTGWLHPGSDKNDCRAPWKCLGSHNEVYALRWETEALCRMGGALEAIIKSAAWTLAKHESSMTVVKSMNRQIWPAALIRASKIVDNSWAVGMARAEKTGQILADAILNKVGGERPITLIGFGLGARVIYNALMHLTEKRAFGFVENAVLMGAPCPSDIASWASMRGIVTGRLINVFSKNDMLLAFMMRQCNYTVGVAGLEPVVGINGVENFDASNAVTAHMRYEHLVGPVLLKLGWEDVIYSEATKQQFQLDLMVAEERERDKKRAHSGIARMQKDVDQLEKETANLQLEDLNTTGSVGAKTGPATAGTNA